MTYNFVTDLGRKFQSTRENEDRFTEEPVKHYVTVTQQEQEPEPVRHVYVTVPQEEPEQEMSGYAYKTDIAEIAGLRPSVDHCARLACKLEAICERITDASGENVVKELFEVEIDLQGVIAEIME